MNPNPETTTKEPTRRLLPAARGSALSGEMQRCLDQMAVGDNTITRYPGGFWYPQYNATPSFGTTTIEALVKRGRLEYCEWKESHGRQFPIKARKTPNVALSHADET